MRTTLFHNFERIERVESVSLCIYSLLVSLHIKKVRVDSSTLIPAYHFYGAPLFISVHVSLSSFQGVYKYPICLSFPLLLL